MNKHKKMLLVVAWALVLPVFIVGQVSFWQGATKKVKAEVTTESQVVDTEELEDELSDAQKKLNKELKEKALLEQEKAQLGTAIYSTQKVINNTKAVITETAGTISRKEAEVKNLNDKIELQKNMLRSLLQQVYYNQGQPILNVVFTSENLADVFSNTEHLLTIEDKIKNLSKEISQTKQQVEQEKIKLAETKEKHEEILDDKLNQKQELVSDQIDVQKDIIEKEATIAELQQKLAELQSDLNVLTGKSYDAKDINEAISFANKKTGVPKGILFAFLTQESGRGKNTGQCTYDDMEQKATAAYIKYGKAHKWNYKPSIDRLKYRKGLFEDLVDALDYSKNKKVSCAIIPANFANYEPNQGGAMGVAQFMSDTWMYGGKPTYWGRVIGATGHKTPDPWSLTDGTMALAFKVKDAGGISTSSSAVKKMVTNYYGASPDSSSVARNYYNNVMYYIKNYDKLISN